MPSTSRPWLHEIDHTGDVGIRITAETRSQLFERAALGTFHVLTDLATVRPAQESTLTVTGRDQEALMVRWLSELNVRHILNHELYCDFRVDRIAETDGEWVLDASVWGEPIDPDRHTVYTEIKAITFHGLEVQETKDGWVVQVIFDM